MFLCVILRPYKCGAAAVSLCVRCLEAQIYLELVCLKTGKGSYAIEETVDCYLDFTGSGIRPMPALRSRDGAGAARSFQERLLSRHFLYT